ncbi:MAG: ATP-binding protein, partial [Gemmatimonadaceae bacterium]
MTTAASPPSAPARRPTVALDPIAEKLASVGLDYPASCLPELVEEATREKLSPLAFLDQLLTRQLERKDERRVTTMLKLSGLPPGKTLEDFD